MGNMFDGMDSALFILTALAVIGLICLLGGIGCGIWWLFNHMQFV